MRTRALVINPPSSVPFVRRSLRLLFVLFVVACSYSAGSDVPRFVAPVGTAASIYRVVLDSLGGVSPTAAMVVAESTVVFQAPAGTPVAWTDFANVPAGLPALLEALSRAPQASTSLPLPNRPIVLSRAESDAIRRADPRAWWTEFARRYPTQRAVFAFSPIAFSGDSNSALLEVVRSCGDTCGGGYLVWLERRRTATWTVRRMYPLWVN